MDRFLILLLSEVLTGNGVSVAARPPNTGCQQRPGSFSTKQDRAAPIKETGKTGNRPFVPKIDPLPGVNDLKTEVIETHPSFNRRE